MMRLPLGSGGTSKRRMSRSHKGQYSLRTRRARSARDMLCERTRRLVRIPPAAAEVAVQSKRCRSDVNDTHQGYAPNGRRSESRDGRILVSPAARGPCAGPWSRCPVRLIPDLPLPWATVAGPVWLFAPETRNAEVLVLDSIARAPPRSGSDMFGRLLSACCTSRRAGLTRPRSSVDSDPLRPRAYRACEILMVASQWLAGELEAGGLPADRIRVVAPGKDLDVAAGGSTGSDGVGGINRASLDAIASWPLSASRTGCHGKGSSNSSRPSRACPMSR